MLNRESLAWAAGFFDGEGSTLHVKGHRLKGGSCVRLSIAQVERETLDRFQAAIGGLGKVTGPYKPRATNQRPIYYWKTARFESSQAAIGFLWEFLSPIKREQAANALRAYHAEPIKRHVRKLA